MRDLLPASRVARLASGRALTQLRLHYRARRLIAGALHVAPAPRGMNRRVDDRALQSPRGSDTRRQAGLAASNALRAPASLRSAFPRRTSTALVVIADPRLLGRPDDAGALVTSRSRRHLVLRHAEPHAPVGRQTRVARGMRGRPTASPPSFTARREFGEGRGGRGLPDRALPCVRAASSLPTRSWLPVSGSGSARSSSTRSRRGRFRDCSHLGSRLRAATTAQPSSGAAGRPGC